eukprot:768761-Hanusia_phi.AAC.2
METLYSDSSATGEIHDAIPGASVEHPTCTAPNSTDVIVTPALALRPRTSTRVPPDSDPTVGSKSTSSSWESTEYSRRTEGT